MNAVGEAHPDKKSSRMIDLCYALRPDPQHVDALVQHKPPLNLLQNRSIDSIQQRDLSIEVIEAVPG